MATEPITWVRYARGKLSNGTRCYYCGRAMVDVARDGCGSQEFGTQGQNNSMCEVYQKARRKG